MLPNQVLCRTRDRWWKCRLPMPVLLAKRLQHTHSTVLMQPENVGPRECRQGTLSCSKISQERQCLSNLQSSASQPGTILYPRGHSVMSGDIVTMGDMPLEPSRQRPGMLLYTLHSQDGPTAYPTPNALAYLED